MADQHKNTKLEQLAWAAGLFEGEGCITANNQNNNGHPRAQLVLGSTDLDIVKRFKDIVGTGVIKERKMKSDKHRRFYVWAVYGKNCRNILLDFMPYMGQRRLEKCKYALKVISELGIANKDKTECPQGHLYAEYSRISADGKRSCRGCWTIYNRKRSLTRG